MTFWGVIFIALIVGGLAVSVYEQQQKQKKRQQAKIDQYNRTWQGRSFQMLESVYILETTTKLDVLSRRIKFICDLYSGFIPASQRPFYQENVLKAIDEYRSKYYDREITATQVAILTSPGLSKMWSFLAESVVRTYERHVAEQTVGMNALKTSTAKQNRKDKMIEKGIFAKQLFEEYQIPDAGHLARIETIRRRVIE